MNRITKEDVSHAFRHLNLVAHSTGALPENAVFTLYHPWSRLVPAIATTSAHGEHIVKSFDGVTDGSRRSLYLWARTMADGIALARKGA